jgi:hypothetical protein
MVKESNMTSPSVTRRWALLAKLWWPCLPCILLVLAALPRSSPAVQHNQEGPASVLWNLDNLEPGRTLVRSLSRNVGLLGLTNWFRPLSVLTTTTFTVANTDDSGPGSLRQAILDANANPGTDTITFSIGSGVQTITLTNGLPTVTDPVTIDGTSQPGFSGQPLIELNGSNVIGDGLTITAGSSAVRGLVIDRFHGHAIKLDTGGSDNIENNYIGTDVSGIARAGNYLDGVFILSSNNRIGGTTSQARNVISGNFQNGIHLAQNASGNVIQGNYIGVDVTGNAALGNNGAGVAFNNNASNNTIGGISIAARNIISGNMSNGISIDDPATHNLVQGNFIGTNVDGTKALLNIFNGVTVSGPNNVIGGPTASPGTPPGNLITNQSPDSSVSGNINIFVFGTGTLIQGNLIGTNANGTAKLGSSSSGIECWGNNTTIGGTVDGARNIISGNQYGVEIANSGTATIQGNFIGTDITGTRAIGNSSSGIEVITPRNLIGGVNAAARNVISGNSTGIRLRDGLQTIQGNFIGTNASGASALPNTADGIVITGYAGNSIGGTEPGAGNIIAFNGANGIAIVPVSTFVSLTKHAIRHNSIFSNNLLGIDLVSNAAVSGSISGFAYDGVTFNDFGDADTGPNNLQNFPVLQSVTTGGNETTIQGTLNTTANASFTIEFFSSNRCNLSGFGEGANYIGTTSVITDANGSANFNVSLPVTLAAGQVVTATATDASESTSEFSACNEVSAPGSAQFVSALYTVNENAGTATITVTRTLGTATTASVDYGTSDGPATSDAGSATAGSDYTPTSGTLSFASGETSKTFTVPIINDSIDEPFYENVSLTLCNPTGGLVLGGRSTALLRIIDDDSPPGVSINDTAVIEGNSGTTNAVFTVSISSLSEQTISLHFATASGTATSGLDYQATNGNLTFMPGETTKTISVPVIGDTLTEEDESFFVNLSSPINVSIVRGQGRATIVDDETPGVRFSSATYNASEGAGSVTINVIRSGDTSSSAAVDYATVDNGVFGSCNTVNGQAQQNCDYVTAAGMLQFAAGETSKTFTVLIIDDLYVEGNETLNLRVNNPVGTSLASQNTAVLTISDNDTVLPMTNPLDNAQFFVRQQYYDFFSRLPDEGGLDYWTAQITQCGSDQSCIRAKRIDVSNAFFYEQEFQETGAYVYRIYKAAFGTLPGAPNRANLIYAQFMPDRSRLIGGSQLDQSKTDFANAFVQRSAFTAVYPSNLNGAQYVDALNANTGNSLTQSLRDALVNGLTSGTETRGTVLRKIADNPAFIDREYNASFVLTQYFGYLRRDPDQAGYDFWLGQVNNGPLRDVSKQHAMVCSFITSAEYQQRLSPVVTHTNAECPR